MGKKELCHIDNLVPSSLLRKAKPIATDLPYPNKTQCVIMVQHSLNIGHHVCPSTVYFIYVVVSSKVLFRMWQCQVAPLRLSTPFIAQWIKRKLLGARWGTKIKLWPEKPRLCSCFAFLFSTTSLSKKVLKSWLLEYTMRRVNGAGTHNSTLYYHSRNRSQELVVLEPIIQLTIAILKTDSYDAMLNAMKYMSVSFSSQIGFKM